MAAFMTMLGGVPILAAEEQPAAAPDGTTNYKGETPPVNVGVIGCGTWGREILKTLSTIKFGPVVAVCDHYPAYLRRGANLAPKAEKYEDYKQLLANKDVQAVIVATPSHQHKEFVLAALEAGKHVYCEAPLATTLDDARAIATAARKHWKLNFQPGLQNRSDKQIVNLIKFVRSGVVGTNLSGRGQFHKKMSWRIATSNPEREAEMNWRLSNATSGGLVGELGVHQLDIANWFYSATPISVEGVGALSHYKDGRDVFDNVAAIFRYPNGICYNYEATIANSFDGEMGMFFGSDSAIMMRERRAWMFKEADAPQLGWEVYAKKDQFYRESGMVLKAGATKQDAQTAKAAASDIVDEKSGLEYSLENFLINSYNLAAGVKDFMDTYGQDSDDDLKAFLKEQDKLREPAADYQDGYDATVTVIKANESILKEGRIEMAREWFQLV